MKKLLSAVLILALIQSMTLNAFGLELPKDNGGSYEIIGGIDGRDINIYATVTEDSKGAEVKVTGGNGNDGTEGPGQPAGYSCVDVDTGLYLNADVYATGGNGGNGTGGQSGGLGGVAVVEVMSGATVTGGIYATGGEGGSCNDVIGSNQAGAGGSAEVILREGTTVVGEINVKGGQTQPNAADAESPADGDFNVNIHAGVVAVPGAKVLSHINVTGSNSSGNGGDAEVFVLFPVDSNKQPSQTENTYFDDINVAGGNGGNGGKATGLDIRKDGATVVAGNITATGGSAANAAAGGNASGLKITGDNVTVVANGNISASGGEGKPSDSGSTAGEGYALELNGKNSTVIVTGNMSGSTAAIKVQNVDEAMANSKIIVNSFDMEDPSNSIVDGSGDGLDEQLGAFVTKVFRYLVSWTTDGADKSAVSVSGLETLDVDADRSYSFAGEDQLVTFSSADYNISVDDEGARYTKDNGGIIDNGNGTMSVKVMGGGWLNKLKLSLSKKQTEPGKKPSGGDKDTVVPADSSTGYALAATPMALVTMRFNDKLYEAAKDKNLTASATVSSGADIVRRNLSKVKVLVDGQEISAENYNLSMEGDILSVEVLWDYLLTLSPGPHTISFAFSTSGCDAQLMI